MLFSKNSNELVTTHGFSAGQAQNQGEFSFVSFKLSERGADLS